MASGANQGLFNILTLSYTIIAVNMRPLILTTFLSFLLIQAADSQTLNAYVRGAEDALAKKDYFSAYNFMRTVHEIEPNNVEYTYKLAEAARLYSAFTRAEQYYQEVADGNKANDFPATTFWLGYVKERLGKYQEALDLYQIYLTEHNDEDSELTAQAQRHIEIAQWALEQLKNKDTTIELIHLGTEINTSFSEFGAHQYDSLLYYTSLRFLIEDAAHPDKPYSKILKSEDNAEGVVDSVLNDAVLHTANTAFNAAKDRVFYSLCEYINASDIRCNLYYRDIVDGVYGIAQKLPDPINVDGYTTTQPFVGYDPKSGREVLYFVSDRPGGKGKQDIWFCYIADKDNFTAPENLGALNTPATDNSPFYHVGSNVLYFSSEGYLGFGGLDIYHSEYNNGTWGEVINMGSPINSSLDDAFYTMSDDEKKGYFSSNRLGSMYLSPDDEACCYDIYYFTKEPIVITLKVLTFNKQTGDSLNYVDVSLTESGVNTQTYSTGDSNSIIVPVKRNASYSVLGEKQDFLPDSATFSTAGLKESTQIEKRLYLAPAQRVLLVRVFEKRNRLPLEGARVEIMELPDGAPRVKQETFATSYIFYVDPHRDMKATGSKKGYLPGSQTFNSSDDPEKDTLIVDLYLELGNLEDFLPLAIYFDNDVPGRKSRSETATERYLETYGPYAASEEEFVKKYTAGVPAAGREAAAKAIRDFFEIDLATGKREFESFMHILEQYLREGLTFTIYLKGYTSPLASNEYNKSLGNRRISSIQNEFKSFRDGILWKYMETGDLVVTQKSFGEETAPPGISDKPENKRQSIYSPEASRERRVEIIEIVK
jgi:tetratricopeptide (TPR) repeat protein